VGTPDMPGQPTWLADQLKAASEDARGQLRAGGAVSEAAPGSAAARFGELLKTLLTSAPFEDTCGHIPRRSAQPVHWIPAVRTLWQCGSCAEQMLDDWIRVDYWRCDLCGRDIASTHPAPSLVHTTWGLVTIHGVACAACDT
jgi:hypothetical protein